MKITLYLKKNNCNKYYKNKVKKKKLFLKIYKIKKSLIINKKFNNMKYKNNIIK